MDPDEYILISYGPWEFSGHVCDDLLPGGCDEPVQERIVYRENYLSEKKPIGMELGFCPAGCGS